MVGSLEGEAKGYGAVGGGKVKTSRKVEGAKVKSTGVSGADAIGEEEGSGVGAGKGSTTVGEIDRSIEE